MEGVGVFSFCLLNLPGFYLKVNYFFSEQKENVRQKVNIEIAKQLITHTRGGMMAHW